MRNTTLLWMAAAALAAGAEKAPKAAAYRFEPEARPVLAETGVAVSSDPKLAMRASGALYMLAVFAEGGAPRLGLFSSSDGGDTFTPPTIISEKGARVSSHGENSPSLAFGKSTETYALWEQSSTDGTDLMFARSLMMGRAFEKPVKVTDKAEPSTNAFSHLAVAPNGHIYAVWLDGRDPAAGPPGTSSVYLAKSTDRGASFGKNIPVGAGVCPCCRPTVAFGSKGEVFVSWRHVFPGQIRDIVVAASRDGGETFTAPVRVAGDNWKINGCPHSGASMLQRNGRLWVSWYSEGSKDDAGIRLSRSDDGGKSFAPPSIVSGNVLDSNHPVLSASDDGRLVLLFQGRDPQKEAGWGAAGPWLIEVAESGEASTPVAVPGNKRSISYPSVLAGSLGRTFFAWTESGEGGRKVMFTRARSR